MHLDTQPFSSSSRLPKCIFRDHMVKQLRLAIFSGGLPPRFQVLAAARAQQFEVSRGPPREALRQLIETASW
jgi:DNA-binding GntR family transcriptional regulator